jgi:competence ComEA-like helix-hairpin-helix protein
MTSRGPGPGSNSVPNLHRKAHSAICQGHLRIPRSIEFQMKEDTMRRSVMAFVLMLALTASFPLMAQRGRGAKPPQAAGTDTKPAAPTPAVNAADVINLNTATAAQIATLPGIGPKAADLIIQYRTKNGPFKKVEEIMNVRGIGEKTFLKLKSRITVGASK